MGYRCIWEEYNMCKENTFKIALCQTLVERDKEANIKKAESFVKIAASNGSKIIALGEMFNCPYRKDAFKEYAEEELNSNTLNRLSSLAKKMGVYIVWWLYT